MGETNLLKREEAAVHLPMLQILFQSTKIEENYNGS